MENQYNATSGPGSSLVVHPLAGLPAAGQPYYIAGLPYSPEGASASEQEPGLVEFWRLLLRNKKTILFSTLAGLLLGIAVGVPIKPVFRAHTSIEILNLNQDFMNTKQTDPTTTTDYSDEVSEEETQSQLLQSDVLMNRVVTKLDPNAVHASGALPMATTGWRSWLHLREKVVLTPRQQMLAKASETLRVRVQPHTRLIEITANSVDPQFAADFVNTLVQEFIKQNIESRFSTTQRTSDWLTREITDARTNLRHSEDALQSYARDSGLIFTDNDAETNVATEKLQQLQRSLSAATADRIGKQSRFELAKNSPPDSLADVLNDTGLQGVNEKINEASRQLADLTAIYNPDYSKVRRAKAELTELQQAFSKKRADILSRIETDYQQSERNEKLLQTAYVAQSREVTGQDEKTIQYNILKREVDSNRQLYDTILQQMKQASIAAALHASNVRVIDPAPLPGLPIFPNFKLNAALGLLLGLVSSIGFVAARERADRTLQMPGDMKQWCDLPELGTIPTAARIKKRSIYPAVSDGLDRKSAILEKGVLRRHVEPVELITSRMKSSLIAEAFRSTLTSILFVGENGSRPRVLVFTSTQPGDGKTTVVSNIGIALAEIRNKVLIIDADLRRPRMHRVFGVPNERGLSNLLQDDFTEENLSGLIQETGIPGLHVLTGGTPTSAASSLLHSPNLSEFLAKVRPEYNMVLIDSPPMMQTTDARVIGRLADAAVLVTRAGTTTRDALMAAKERFEQDHIRVLGYVLNSWDPKRSAGSYYYNQYKKYAYWPNSEESAAN
jgi:succinoglycan biosynthesis transport protein ExoP